MAREVTQLAKELPGYQTTITAKIQRFIPIRRETDSLGIPKSSVK
jgi:hypothetical protein